jgi:hypothetical protein
LSGEKSRVFLSDHPQPARSIFNYGDSRHEKYGTKAQIQTHTRNVSDGTVKFQGNSVLELPTRKNFDWALSPRIAPTCALNDSKKFEITGKIGY